MTAWGTAPAHGWLRFCATCGARLVFVEVGPAGKTKQALRRYGTAVGKHLRSSPRCRNTGSFLGGELTACRCERRILIQREDGLRCARCEGFVAPEVAPPRRRRPKAAS
jgi:hypothetical protein